MVTKEKDEELALFLEMRSNRERNKPSAGINGAIVPPPSKALLFPAQIRKTAADRFLDSENGKSDYDWLITPPGTPLILAGNHADSQKTIMNQVMSNARPTALQSRLINVQESVSKDNACLKSLTLGKKTSTAKIGSRRAPSNGEPIMKPRQRLATPTSPLSSKSSSSLTPSPRASLPSAKPNAPVRSSTPTKSIPRSSTPTSRPSLPAIKVTTRSITPNRQHLIPASQPAMSKPASKSNPASLGTSPTAKSRTWKPDEMPGFSLEAPPNLRTSLPERSASTSRGRPACTNPQSSNENAQNGRQRRQSCSPARGRSTSSNAYRISAPTKGKTKCCDDVNPVLMGTKMVEMVVNMRKLAPPKKEDQVVSAGKSGVLDGSGFGRSLSKKSLDMALRHMDIRRSVSANLRPLMTHIPASSIYSVRSGGAAKGRASSSSDSPHATRSIASSESSVNNNPFNADGSEMNDSFCGSDRGNSSPIRHDCRV